MHLSIHNASNLEVNNKHSKCEHENICFRQMCLYVSLVLKLVMVEFAQKNVILTSEYTATKTLCSLVHKKTMSLFPGSGNKTGTTPKFRSLATATVALLTSSFVSQQVFHQVLTAGLAEGMKMNFLSSLGVLTSRWVNLHTSNFQLWVLQIQCCVPVCTIYHLLTTLSVNVDYGGKTPTEHREITECLWTLPYGYVSLIQSKT